MIQTEISIYSRGHERSIAKKASPATLLWSWMPIKYLPVDIILFKINSARPHTAPKSSGSSHYPKQTPAPAFLPPQ